MKTQTIIPHPTILNYVSHIVVIENNNIYHEAILPLIANGYPSITFQITDTGLSISNNKKMDSLVLYGQNIKPIELHTRGYVIIIAYFLYPHMLKALFGIDAKELTNISIDLNYSEPARSMSLQEQLLNTISLDKRLQLMNNYVLKLADRYKPGINNTISFAAQAIQKSRGLISLTHVQQEFFVTERTLQRMFELHVGVSPKTFSRICQFHYALQQLSQNQFTGMTDIAFESGYADQSHLIRTFKEFTNYTPLEYFKSASEFPR
ncbi:helix-turn-helix domain-containing protein [Mucilaginibacter sp. NFX135]|uniref:helix-turn-helix domain-containing protein n=1 Tax=Mucilaginibacter sp. NFX135 TaxID=3402687 RepID=UPI003AFA15E9